MSNGRHPLSIRHSNEDKPVKESLVTVFFTHAVMRKSLVPTHF